MLTVILTLAGLLASAATYLVLAERQPRGTRLLWLAGVLTLVGALAITGDDGIAWPWRALAWVAFFALVAAWIRTDERVRS